MSRPDPNKIMLEIRNLNVEVEGKEILKDVNISIGEGERIALFGPNGSGKTSLIMAIMGLSNYKVTKGEIIFRGKVINDLPVDERAKMGIGTLFQRPPVVRGVTTRQITEIAGSKKGNIKDLAGRLKMEDFLDRDINLGFSGGEMKRSELMQLIAQGPLLSLIDEPESGVDLENISLIGEEIKKLLDGSGSKPQKSCLIITHTGYILDYVPMDKGCVMVDGTIRCMHKSREVLESIRKHGYERCAICDGKED